MTGWRAMSVVAVGRRRSPPLLIALSLLGASLGGAAQIEPAAQSELRRGLAMVGSKTSDEPALRLERQTREPSAAFMLGSALGAWNSAAATLDYDLKTPSGDGDDTEAIAIDCYDEKVAFAHLEARRQSLGLTRQQVVDGAGLSERGVLGSWQARQSNAPPRCR